MPNIFIDHISFLVRDLDQRASDWATLLGVLSPGHLDQVTEGEGADVQEGVRMRWCTFQNPDPTGVSIQLWTASEPGTWVDKVLDKRGEYVHHVCFLSDDFDTMCSDLAAAGVPLLLDAPSNPDTMPWLKWNFVPVRQDPRHAARARHALPAVRQPLDRPPRQRREPRARRRAAQALRRLLMSPRRRCSTSNFERFCTIRVPRITGPRRAGTLRVRRNRAFLHDSACGNLFAPSDGWREVWGHDAGRGRVARRRCWWSWPASPSSRASTPCCAARWPGPR